MTKINNNTWIKHWSGKWSLLSCSYFGEQYTKTIKDYLGTKLDNCTIIIKEGISTCYFLKNELDKFGNDLSNIVKKDPSIINHWANELKKRTDKILSIMEIGKEDPSIYTYKKFIEALYSYGQAHIATKKVVDYLDTESLKKFLPILEESRLYSERVYDETESFMNRFVQNLNKSKAQDILCMLKEELNIYLTDNVTFPFELENRKIISAIVFNNGVGRLYVGAEAIKIEKDITKPSKDIIGKCAYGGKVKGIARIIIDPKINNTFNEGDILVTGMTRPEFIPLIKISSAIVTDAGGILSHAAITAREMKKPGIIGTENATKIIKDGEYIFVDADNGTITLVNK